MKRIIKSFLILSLLLIISGLAFPQDTSKISPYFSFQYFKDSADSIYLKATLTYSKNRVELPMPGMKISFFGGTKKGILAETITDDKGVGIFDLNNKSDFSADKNGMWPFSASFEGNDTIDPASSDILIRNASLTMKLDDADSVKTITIHAEKLENGKMVPASGETLILYVPRMFSLLTIGEITLDETGTGSVEFPPDLPGDADGNISIIARIEEHPEFGNIEKISTLKWGIPQIILDHSSHRALWTKTAPKWMIYTLSILLTGVWGHYIFVFISLIRIRIDSRRNKEEKNYQK